jgi:NAD-dependent deacetylase
MPCDFDAALLKLVRSADSIVAFTGAGVSAESGIPTFRNALTGLWSKYNPEELATPQAFEKHADLVSRWYDQRRCAVACCRPNPGHDALATLQRMTTARGRFTLITQNVDGLHEAAGSTAVIELHGTLHAWRCVRCGDRAEERGPAFEFYPRRCACGGRKRPDVVWFGEQLPPEAISKAQRATEQCELFLSLGTSGVVHPAAALIELAWNSGAAILEINPEQTPYSHLANWAIRGKTGEVLPRLIAEAFEKDGSVARSRS